MNTITIQATFQTNDFAVFQSLFKKYKVKTKVIEQENKPNEVTLKAMEEARAMRSDKNRKTYSDVEEFLDFLKS